MYPGKFAEEIVELNRAIARKSAFEQAIAAEVRFVNFLHETSLNLRKCCITKLQYLSSIFQCYVLLLKSANHFKLAQKNKFVGISALEAFNQQ